MKVPTLDDLAARLEQVALKRGRWGRGGLIACCPCHADTHPSLSIDVAPDGRLLAHCWSGCDQRAVAIALGLHRAPAGWQPPLPPAPRPRQQLKPRPAAPPALIVRSNRYLLRDASGVLVAIHHRLDLATGEKRLWWSRPDGQRGLDRPVTDLPLFGSERIARLPLSTALVITEGEKAAVALASAGIPALATVCGANAIPGPASLAILAGRSVILWPDADEPGRHHMAAIASRLVGVAASISIVEPPADAPKGLDAADVTLEQRRALVAAAQRWAAPPVPADLPRPKVIGWTAGGRRIVRPREERDHAG